MTGSGKTGLCIGLLEEAAIENIPAIIIDPKGDIANLLLTFPTCEAVIFFPGSITMTPRKKSYL
jgi:DNA helicase HerA-like ATPase